MVLKKKVVNDEKLTKITWYKNYKIKRTTKNKEPRKIRRMGSRHQDSCGSELQVLSHVFPDK